MTPTESEIARLLAIEAAAREYVECSKTPPDEEDIAWLDWVERAAILRNRLADALAVRA